MKNLKNSLWLGLSLLLAGAPLLRAQTNADTDAVVTAGAGNASMAVNAHSADSHASREGIVAIVSTFGMPVLIVGMALFFKFRRDRLTHETLRAMIEKGVPITPELLAQLKNKDSEDLKPNSASRHLLPGLICAGVGAALLISNFNSNQSGIPGVPAAAGWIVLFVGVAFLIVWLVERKNKNDAQPPRS
jgi:ABC-type Fe3+-siderophore transport system permease subunit